MAAKATQMELLKQILRLKQEGLSISAIMRATGVSRPTIRKYLNRISDAGIDEADIAIVDDKSLADKVYNNDTTIIKSLRFELLLEHFKYAETELRKTGVTRELLWTEYKVQNPDGYNYSQYCHHFNEFIKKREVVMHLEHRAGETIMIDFAGKKISYVDPESGELIPCHVFVAVLPHSGLIFCYAVHSQNTYEFISCINAMLKYFGGVTLVIICDNLRTAVTRPSRYEPVFTEMCNQLSEYYCTSFAATRPYKPRDKAMVERAVRIVYTNIYAPLRNQVFTSVRELNQAIAVQLNKLNDKRYKGSPYSRRQLFEQYEMALLKSLPAEAFSPKKAVVATVQRNYHIQLSEDHRYYSVPYAYAGKKVKVLYDNKTLEIYYDHSRIAVHIRTSAGRSYTTIREHMPSNHQNAMNIKGWTRADMLARAAQVGPNTSKAVDHILSGSIYPEQNYKACHGMLMLQGLYGPARLEAACTRALQGTRINYSMIKNILRLKLDTQTEIFDSNPLPDHENIRGPENYK